MCACVAGVGGGVDREASVSVILIWKEEVITTAPRQNSVSALNCLAVSPSSTRRLGGLLELTVVSF